LTALLHTAGLNVKLCSNRPSQLQNRPAIQQNSILLSADNCRVSFALNRSWIQNNNDIITMWKKLPVAL